MNECHSLKRTSNKEWNFFIAQINNIGRSNEILGWEGVGNRQLFCFCKV
jgi:hypothetical protein